MKSAVVATRIPGEQAKRLTEIAEANKLTVSELLAIVLNEWLAKLPEMR